MKTLRPGSPVEQGLFYRLYTLFGSARQFQSVPPTGKRAALSLCMAASILQIAYDPALLQLRQIMLEKNGYQVVSGLGNKDGVARARTRQFDLILIGFSSSFQIRQEAIRLLRQTCPNAPIVVLQAHWYEKFPDADFATLSEDPDTWLTAIANCLKKA